MDSITIRRKFLDFFASKGHQIVPSAPLVLKNDPSLLFTNSGMVQFKDYFLGNATPKYKRIADTQKCLRVSGKHNDLEDVGLDTYHHTMFEMLGNWSFGDYFKKEAIEWAWELLTEVYQLPKDKLYVSVFGGDKKDNLPVDEEAKDLWRRFVADDRIIHGVKKDNFWEMGESGPCGPCSEIHIDLRNDPNDKRPGRDLVNSDHPQVVEIWNLVFIQFNRLASGALEPLPDKHVDTGMGFERLCMAIQKKTSNYDTDVFSPLIEFVATHAHVKYTGKLDNKTDIAIRVIADHIRAVSFAISDGQLPSNTGAGYVIRRILRRAVRYGFSYLNFKEPFIHRLVPLLALQLKDVFPELHQQLDYVERVVQEEEISFLRTLEDGLKRLDSWIAETEKFAAIMPKALGKEGEGEPKLNGAKVFMLFDTYGFPKDLTLLILKEKGKLQYLWDNWEEQFNIELERQKARSRVDASKETGDWVVYGDEPMSLITDDPPYYDKEKAFVGYDVTDFTSNILKFRSVIKKGDNFLEIVLKQTPFYAESGGQVGDTGYLDLDNGVRIPILNTKKDNGLTVHFAKISADNNPLVGSVVSKPVHAVVDAARRTSIKKNHSATHLLHAALRQVLGKHVEQRGSLVNENLLRFDFSHFAQMTREELSKIEEIVNDKIMENISLDEKRNVPIEKAKSFGAMALFGEKYGEFVRVITFDPKFSVELCGGTHVPATGNIGLFKILSESSVAAGVRRIEAVTGEGALSYFRQQLAMLDEVKSLLKNPKDVSASLQSLIEEKHALEKKIEAVNAEKATDIFNSLQGKISNNAIIERVSVPNADVLKNISFSLRNKYPNLLLVLAADIEGKPQISVMLGEDAVKTSKYNAQQLIKELAKEIEGGGGGQPFYATAGGKNLSGLAQVITKAKALLVA
ncbi:MAG: alanine--tRNA ligase [Bacteroidota bacterium]